MAADAAVAHDDTGGNEASTTAVEDACPDAQRFGAQPLFTRSRGTHRRPHCHGSLHSKAPPAFPAGKHDCCKSSGCQGHCGYVPLAFDVSLTRHSPASSRVRPVSAERLVVAPADTHFRPPILS